MLYVCNIFEMPNQVEVLSPSHLVSLVAPSEQPPTPEGVASDRHLRVEIHDINEPLDDHILPDTEHIAALIDFMRAWTHDDGAMLVHCVAGISRSMAAALIGLVVKAPGREAEAARLVRAAAPHAYPNRRMIALADELLGCAGRLIEAREAMGEADLLPFAPLVRLDLLR